MLRSMVILVASTCLLSCASTTPPSVNCNQQDWLALGNTSALKGKSIRLFDQYIKQCGETLPAVAKTQFIQGYTEGLVEYCTYELGFQRGSANLDKNNICPLESRKNFEDGYKMGYFSYKEKMSDIEKFKKFNELENQQKSLNKSVADDRKTGN